MDTVGVCVAMEQNHATSISGHYEPVPIKNQVLF